MNGSMYREILEKKSATSLGDGRNFVLQHDNYPKISQNLERNGLKIMVLVLSIGQVSLLTWIQLRICGILWRFKVHKRNIQNIKQLEELCKEEWGKVTLDQCGKLVANYRKWLEAVKQNRGYATKY